MKSGIKVKIINRELLTLIESGGLKSCVQISQQVSTNSSFQSSQNTLGLVATSLLKSKE
jgi:hypothetical protein